MMRAVVFLSCVGAALYALLVVTNSTTTVNPAGTKAEVVARDTRLKVWGPYLPDRPLKQLAATKQFTPPQQKIAPRIAAARSPPATADQTVTSSNQAGKRLASLEAQVPARDHEGFWFVVSRAAWVHAGPS